MHLKVFVKLKKTLKPSRLGKKTQKTQKNPKKPKKTHWAGFFLKNPGFFQPWHVELPLPYLLQILKRLILALHDGGHPAQGGLLQLLAPVETVPELEQTHVVLRNVVDQVAGRVDLAQRQLVVILAKNSFLKLHVLLLYY